jgi:catechol 2,3-dioxygenase-like lactoylglutathione lyase family enzyme
MITGTDFLVMHTNDFDKAVDFYENTLGLPLSVRYGKMPGAEFETGNLTIAVMKSDAFGMEYRTTTNPLALRVDDVHAARAELEAKGIEFAPDTIDSGVCHMAFFRDPDGNALMLHHRYAPRT